MKKALKIIGITLLILVAFIMAAPFIFKKQIIQLVKDTVNEQLNAKVNFGEFDLTLLSTFPNFSLSIDSLSVANVGDFEGDTLLSASNITLGLDLMSVIKGEEYKINTIELDRPRIKALVLKDGRANWDITKPSADTTAAADTAAATPFKMTLKNLEIKNAYILYDDASLGVVTELVNMNHTLKGDFTLDNFVMETFTDIEKFSVAYGGVKYMNKVKTVVKADIEADMPSFKFTFKQNEFSLNALTLGLDGYFAMPKDDMEMDLKFKANQTEFKNILSLVPGVYTAEFADVKTKGLLTLDGFVKGIYNDTKMPAFNLKLLIKDAMFQYPALPKSANNIQVDLVVDNKTGNPDATVIDLRRFHVEMAGNPVDAKLYVSTPVSDANIKAELLAKLDLESVKDIIPLEKDDKLNGHIDANVKMAGRMSYIDKEEYDKFDAAGSVIIKQMNYVSKSLGYPTEIKSMKLDFTPKYVVLDNFDALVGKSDIQLSGRIDNFLQYALKDSLLQGNFTLNSSLLDLNELMAEDTTAAKPATPADTASAPMTLIEVPSNLDVVLRTTIKKLVYDNYNITNVSGAVKIKDSKMSMENLKLDMNDLEGTVLMSGVYNTQNIKKPSADFDMNISNFDIAKTFKMFNSVQKLAPIGKYTKGKFGTSLKFTTLLNQHMEPDLNTLTGNGKLVTKSVVIEGFEPIDKLADALKQAKYKKLTMQDVNASYEFKDGRVHIKETPVKINNSMVKITGSTGFDQTIDYKWAMEIPRSEFGSQANAAAGSLLDKINKEAGTNVSMSEKIKLNVIFGGTATKPTVKTDLANMVNKAAIKEQVKEQVKEVITKAVDDAKEKARAEADKIMKDAQAKADQLKAEAKSLADKTKQEGYAAVDKTVADAKNPLAKKGAELAAPAAKKEVDKKVQKILDEANKKADDILINAKAEADKKLQ
jgi:hypothetical protein